MLNSTILQGAGSFAASVGETSTQCVGEPEEFGRPDYQSTQQVEHTKRRERKEDKAREVKVESEGTSYWVEPNRTVLSSDQETRVVYNIFRGGYSLLPSGEHHEGFQTLEEREAVQQSLGKYTKGLKVSLEGNIGSGEWARWSGHE